MINENNTIDINFFWFNEPVYSIKDSILIITTSPETDFWQKTHYDFQKDNGHCLLTRVKYDFTLTVKTEFYPNNQYDQCGLFVRIDPENWIKMSVEYENAEFSRLGSVVTNYGYSDWATIDITSDINRMWYRISKNKNDFLMEYSKDGSLWRQLRLTHLHAELSGLSAGVYACSPGKSGFQSRFSNFSLGESLWKKSS